MERPFNRREALEKLHVAIDYLDDLPDSYWFDIGLSLDDSEVDNFCSKHSRFGNICGNPEFWKKRLELWFPQVSLVGLKGPEYRARYQLAMADELEVRLKDIRRSIQGNSKLRELERKIRNRKLSSKERHELSKERKEIYNELMEAKGGDEIRYRIVSLREEAYKILPEPTDEDSDEDD